MKNPTEYVKMRVLAAIDMAQGRSIRERIRKVSELTFEDEQGQRHRFTWRTIETWRCRYRKHGFTAICPGERSDKGKTRKVSPEQLLEAIEQVKPFFNGNSFNLAELYRRCIEKGLLRRDRVAPNTFRRLVKQFELLKPDKEASNKLRLAFAKRHANEAWQSDTLFGPRVAVPGGRFAQSKLIAFIDDASRLCCHGQFFTEENSPAFKTALKAAFYKRGLPQMLYVDNGSIYSSSELSSICTRLGVRLCHTPVRDGAAKGKSLQDWFAWHGEDLYDELKHIRNALPSVQALIQQSPTRSAPDIVTPLAQAHAVLATRYRRKNLPQPKQLTLQI